MAPTEPVILAESLTKHYGRARLPAVDGLNLKINRGEIFGLLGPNGAGKTTTIRMLCGLFPPTAGKIVILGRDLSTGAANVKRHLGVVPQDIALYPTLTAWENLLFLGRMYGLRGPNLRETVAGYLAVMGLEACARQRIDTFSGGMKRRVNLIAGLLHAPVILFLDEPTAGIDVQSKNAIIEYLRRLNREQGTTIIYTSHYLEEAEALCSRVAVIDRGRLVAEGEPASLISGSKGCRSLEDVFLSVTGRQFRDG